MRRDLTDGLVLRWSTAKDVEDLAKLNSLVFRWDQNEPNLGLANVVRRCMRGDHPSMGPEDVMVVEDIHKEGNRIVACAFYLQEEWEYDGIVVPVARPDIVATEPAYRNRGLIRAALEVMHERAEREGRPVQGITGIPYFYRQFGYEYAVDERGHVAVALGLLPDKPADEEPYRLRQARTEDVPAIAACYRQQQAGYLVSRRLPASFWQYYIDAEHEMEPMWNDERLRVVERAGGDFRGFVFTPYRRSDDTFTVSMIGLVPGTNLAHAAPALLRELKRLGEQTTVKRSPTPSDAPDKPLQKLVLELGRNHPLYETLEPGWLPHREAPSAWYVRVPDLPRLLRLVAPALERRLLNSRFTGHSGELKLDFYRGGLRMCFEDGKLKTVEDCRFGAYDSSAKGGFPPLPFLCLVFGHSSLDELRAAYPDIWVDGEAEAFLKTLFPKRASRLVD
ncbi:GNAT family N-acetyltransferase [Actinopolymorpha pittospori]|uniref:GNAT superfamily N-acetyltransferase n=1 Tax=Actinopolymorpha pittospori TaxID=648752 RepID=A0A927MW82_9ACTN|nr:GNAT family N-acetyltransferase [Actinopolymorpha pittospori]MBE1605908.1 GNAT superfamily N-acetyltransferase [Actinopolymorpha pittospori]